MILYSSNKKVIATFNGLCDRLTKIHAGKYDYTYSVYRGVKYKICIRCPVHGDFYAYVGNHIKGHGCDKCARAELPQCTAFTRDRFIENAVRTHGDTYTYNNFVYTNARTPSYITCKIHGDFKQSPDNHARLRNGCPHCAGLWVNSNTKNKPSIIYILKLLHPAVYKIGITSQSIELRNIRIRGNYEVLYEFNIDSMKEAYIVEQYLLALHKPFRYTESTPLASGNTELFTKLLPDIQTIVSKFLEEHELLSDS